MSANAIDKVKPLVSWLKSNKFRKEANTISKLYKIQKYAISAAEANRLKEWLNDNKSQLSFDQLFNGKMRILIPFNTEEQRNLNQIVAFLKKEGYQPAGGKFFEVKKVKQKLRRLETGEEYEEEVEVADLKVSKKETRVIPKGPRKGEEIESTSTTSISKALNSPKNKAPDWMREWWEKNQAEYVKNYNWNQLESAFKEGQITSEHSVVISRDPIDVLRMSDHRNIRSCHSEGGSYFQCAISESRGNGLVAYLVSTSDIKILLKSKDAPEGAGIDHLDSEEIFRDADRGVAGIAPVSRIRLRKYVDTYHDYEFAAPEHRAYGPSIPGFKNVVLNWAWDSQKDLFDDYGVPDMIDLEMHGGSYRDTSDGEVLNAFFNQGGVETDFIGNVETESDDEESVYEMWEAEIDEVNERAADELEHISFYASLEDVGEVPYISAGASIECKIPLTGWEDVELDGQLARTTSGFNPIPFGWGYSKERREFENLIEHDEYGDLEELDVNQSEKVLTYRIHFTCEDCNNPDDVDNYFDYVKRDIDGMYNEYLEKVRKKMVEEGYIGQIEYDRVAERLDSMAFNYFDVLGGEEDDYDGEIWVTSKVEAVPLNIELPPILFSQTAGYSQYSIPRIFNAVKAGPSNYKLAEEPVIVTDMINKIAEEAYRAAEKQLTFSFYEKEKLTDYSKALHDLQLHIHVYQRNLRSLSMKVVIQVHQEENHILFLEKFVRQLDKSFPQIIQPVIQSLKQKIKVATAGAKEKADAFFGGAQMMSIIRNLKGFSQPDVVRLATWVERNWNNFTNAEKEVAYFQYLIPAQRNGDYIHRDDLDTPRFWDTYMQQHPDVDVSYRWSGGISMKDVMPYTDLNAPIGEGLPKPE